MRRGIITIIRHRRREEKDNNKQNKSSRRRYYIEGCRACGRITETPASLLGLEVLPLMSEFWIKQ
eukprot:5151977-Heterocapsa_arctica.AAC.1